MLFFFRGRIRGKVLARITDILKELRRRNVFKVGMVYAIVAWLIIQIAATTFPVLNLPPWAITLVTVLIIIGFPLILLFAWAFEMTPEGFKPTHHVELDESITHITGRKFDMVCWLESFRCQLKSPCKKQDDGKAYND